MDGAGHAGGLRFPPAPWRLGGRMWLALVRAPELPRLPADLSPLLPGTALLLLARYRTGVLRYDELIVGQAVRRGARVGLRVDLIRVDDGASLRGGREIWGLPKRLAAFEWDADRVRIREESGLLGEVRFGSARLRAPRVPLPLAVFGAPGGARGLARGRLVGRPAAARVEVAAWSPTAGVRLASGWAVAAAVVEPFRMRIDAPRLLGPAPEGAVTG